MSDVQILHVKSFFAENILCIYTCYAGVETPLKNVGVNRHLNMKIPGHGLDRDQNHNDSVTPLGWSRHRLPLCLRYKIFFAKFGTTVYIKGQAHAFISCMTHLSRSCCRYGIQIPRARLRHFNLFNYVAWQPLYGSQTTSSPPRSINSVFFTDKLIGLNTDPLYYINICWIFIGNSFHRDLYRRNRNYGT